MVRLEALVSSAVRSNTMEGFAWKVWRDLEALHADNAHMVFQSALELGMCLQRIAMKEWVALHLPFWPEVAYDAVGRREVAEGRPLQQQALPIMPDTSGVT